MNIVFWVIQGLLALVFLFAGSMKALQPKEKLLATGKMDWVADYPATSVRGIGILELLAVPGLILPMLLDIAPILTPLAALGLILTMVGAALHHYRRGETAKIGTNVFLLVLALVVVIGRLAVEPVI